MLAVAAVLAILAALVAQVAVEQALLAQRRVLVQQILVVVVAVDIQQVMVATAAQASSSFPMLAHNNLVAVSSLQVVVTPFTHLQLLALLFQLHL